MSHLGEWLRISGKAALHLRHVLCIDLSSFEAASALWINAKAAQDVQESGKAAGIVAK